MTLVLWLCVSMLGIAGLLALIRITLGPTMYNRAIALDVIVATAVAGLGVEAAVNEHTATLPILVVLALVGFVGSVSIARFAVREREGDKP